MSITAPTHIHPHEAVGATQAGLPVSLLHGPGLTRHLAEAICATDAFAQDPGGDLYVYRGGVYCPGGEKHIKQRVKALLVDWGLTKDWTPIRAANVVEYIRTDAPYLFETPEPDWLNLRNGLLYIPNQTRFPHTSDHLSTLQLPVTYDPEAKCPAWERFVATTFPADAPELAWELVAWVMCPDMSVQKAALLLGEGANGKSTFLAALTAFLGQENVAGLSLHQLEYDRFAKARLLGKLANICTDLPSAALAGTATFKALTGGDLLVAERKYHDSVEFRPFAKLLIAANHAPRSYDSSHAYFRRWLVVPFERTFEPHEQLPRTELDAALADPRELSGVLNHALAVLPRLRQQGFTESASMKAAWSEFQTTTDPLSVWLERHTIEDSNAQVTKKELLDAFNQACQIAGRPGMPAQGFGKAIRRLRPGLVEAERTVHGKVVEVWLGLGRKQEG